MSIHKGISIIICCHNSANLLPETIKHICNLKINVQIKTELLIIDNNSTDDTSEVSEKLLKKYNCPIPYRILHQPELGLSFARKMGLQNSIYEYLLFCDDDNWLSENYLNEGFNIMESDEKIGVLGGESEAVFEGSIPEWFTEHEQNYSVGKQAEKSGDITQSWNVLWGAGMFIKKSALEELYTKGFHSFLSDRKGSQLTSGGDIEKCYALRLAGWKIWYSDKLKLRHFIPEKRLKWSYLRKLNRGFGAQKVDFDPYLNAFKYSSEENESDNKWHIQVYRLLGKLRGYGLRKLVSMNSAAAGDNEVLRIEKTIGRLQELLKIRGKYKLRIEKVKEAKWRNTLS